MENKSWKESCPKSRRPEITDLETFMNPELFDVFTAFAGFILQEYDLRFGIPTWTEKHGWTYRIGKSGVYLFTGMLIENDRIVLDDVVVSGSEQYDLLIEHIKDIYVKSKDSFYAEIAEKNERQRIRTAERLAKEKREKDRLQSLIVKEKYNVFNWPAKLDISKLNRLYMQDAKGIQDEILADEIGLTIYLRCKYGKEDMERMNKYIIRCHGCGAELYGDSDFRQCSCGRQYSYKEYRRSYRRNNMPTGAAAKTFIAFMQNWGRAKTYQEKIVLIDTMLHQFHLSLVSGAVHRPVAMNFIDGSRSSVEQIISKLAINA